MIAPSQQLRWEDLPPLIQVCLEETWESYLHGSVPVGAVVAGPDGSILLRGRNHRSEASGPGSSVRGSKLAHAELNALIPLSRLDVDPHLCVLYTSLEPCPLCIGALVMSGVHNVHYLARDPYAGSVNLLGTTPYLASKPVKTFGPSDTRLEACILALNTAQGIQRWPADVWLQVSQKWNAVLPDAVRFGERLLQNGDLSRMCVARTPAREVFRGLFEQWEIFENL